MIVTCKDTQLKTYWLIKHLALWKIFFLTITFCKTLLGVMKCPQKHNTIQLNEANNDEFLPCIKSSARLCDPEVSKMQILSL